MSNLIVNLRGCNGSGKTHAVRAFLERLPNEKLNVQQLKSGKIRPAGYKVDATSWGIQKPIYVIGSYENACGGLDGIATQNEAALRILQMYEYGHVLAEGLLASKSGANGILMSSLKGSNVLCGFLDTPWEVCVERVLARRAKAGNDKPFDPEKTMRGAFKGCLRAAELLTEAGGFDVRKVDYKRAVAVVREFLLEAENGA